MTQNYSGREFLMSRSGESPVDLDSIKNSFTSVDRTIPNFGYPPAETPSVPPARRAPLRSPPLDFPNCARPLRPPRPPLRPGAAAPGTTNDRAGRTGLLAETNGTAAQRRPHRSGSGTGDSGGSRRLSKKSQAAADGPVPASHAVGTVSAHLQAFPQGLHRHSVRSVPFYMPPPQPARGGDRPDFGAAALVRIFQLHQRLCRGVMVTANALAQDLGVAGRTVQRDIALMRDQLGAPV